MCIDPVGSGWGDFLTQPTMVGKKKIQLNSTHHISPTQPNPTHMGRIGSGWTRGFDNLLLLLLDWVEKNININILKKT